MKKVFLVCFSLCFIVLQVSAQKPMFNQNDNLVGFSLGFGGAHPMYGKYYKSTPYISGFYERCIIGELFDQKSSLGVGGLVGFMSTRWDDKSSKWGYNHFLIGARGAFHYTFLTNLDTYACAILGWRTSSWKDTSSPSGVKLPGHKDYSGFVNDVYVGGRYYFHESISAYLELGYGWGATANIGISFKF